MIDMRYCPVTAQLDVEDEAPAPDGDGRWLDEEHMEWRLRVQAEPRAGDKVHTFGTLRLLGSFDGHLTARLEL